MLVRGSEDKAPRGDYCALELHVPAGNGAVPGQTPHHHHHDHSLSDHLGHKHTPDAVPAGPLLLHTLSEL